MNSFRLHIWCHFVIQNYTKLNRNNTILPTIDCNQKKKKKVQYFSLVICWHFSSKNKKSSKERNHTRIASKGRVLSPQGALIVFPCIGSETQVTICPAWRTALIKWGSLTLIFSAPILQIIVILPGLLLGFKISMRLTSSFGSILLLTCIE